MQEKSKEYLKALLQIQFDKYLKLKMRGYCKKIYDIAINTDLGFDYIDNFKKLYFDKFNDEL